MMYEVDDVVKELKRSDQRVQFGAGHVAHGVANCLRGKP